MTTYFRSMFLAAGLVALPALAQPATRLGFQANLLSPQSKILRSAVDDQSGLGAGLHLALDFKGGHALRPRLDYLYFPTRTDTFSGGVTSDYRLRGLSAGADYLYHLDRGTQGFYVLAGLAITRWKIETDEVSIVTVYPNPPVVTRTPVNETSTKTGFSFGVGHQFTPRVGVEARYQIGRIFNSDANFLQAGATFRF